MDKGIVETFLSLSGEIARVDKLLRPLKNRMAALETAILAEMDSRGIDEVHCAGEVVKRIESKRTPALNRAHVMTGLSAVLGVEAASAVLAAAMTRRTSSLITALSKKGGGGGGGGGEAGAS